MYRVLLCRNCHIIWWYRLFRYGELPDIKQLANSYQILIFRFQIVLHFAAVMLSDGQFTSFVENIHFCSDDTLNVLILCRLIESCVLITSLLNTVPVRSWFRHIPCYIDPLVNINITDGILTILNVTRKNFDDIIDGGVYKIVNKVNI